MIDLLRRIESKVDHLLSLLGEENSGGMSCICGIVGLFMLAGSFRSYADG